MLFSFNNILLAVFCIAAVSSAGFPSATLAGKANYIQSGNPVLQNGRNVWLQNCEGCHGYGIADAPNPMQPDDWKHRVIKDRQLLYSHAIEGYIGADYSMMPARGGNDELDDEQVKAAVDYMMFLANFYIKQQNNLKGDL